MNIWIGIPSGNRISILQSTVRSWKALGFKVALITWDEMTYEILKEEVDFIMKENERKCHGANHNKLAASIPEKWDAYIVGNDDTHPLSGLQYLAECVEKFPGFVIGISAGHLALCWPVATRGWYEKHGGINLEERYHHDWGDYDLAQQAIAEGAYVQCPDICFEHRHVVSPEYQRDHDLAHAVSDREKDTALYHSKWKKALVIKTIYRVQK